MTGWSQYAVVLICRDIDRFEHNNLFAHELAAAFESLGVRLRTLDYRRQPADVRTALMDPECRFFLCFNGFGSELKLSGLSRQGWVSAYQAFRKPLFDLMHDCPAHEAMAHQIGMTGPERNLLLTDYGYAAMATDLGCSNVRFVPSIMFPATIGPDVPPLEKRSIDALLPVGLVPVSLVEKRHHAAGSYKNRVYNFVFEDVTTRAIHDWQLDPIAELFSTCREADLRLDLTSADGRFLLTTVLDRVKFGRRRRLLRAIAHLPVTVMGDRPIDEDLPDSRLTFVAPRPVKELLAMMSDSRCVLCPTPHMTGFHERVLGAFSAGAAVVSSPNRVLEASFVHGRDLVFFRNESEIAGVIEDLLGNQDRLEAIAGNGGKRAMQLFHPVRLAETILSLLDLRAPE